jgi:hypothetical protein
MGILDASPPTADADDSTKIPASNVYPHILPLSISHSPEAQTLNFWSSVHSKETSSDSPEQAVDIPLPLSSARGSEGHPPDSPSSVQHKRPPPDSPEEAASIVNTTSDQQVKADNIRVLFSVLPGILQYLIDAATMVEWLLKDCDVRIIVATLVVVVILCYVLYDLCAYTLRGDIILVQ